MEALILTATVVLASLVSGTLMDFVKRFIKTDKKWVNHLISWILSIVAAFVAYAIGYLPAASEPWWVWILIEGVGIGLIANGIYTIDVVKKFYDFIFEFIDGKWYVTEKK